MIEGELSEKEKGIRLAMIFRIIPPPRAVKKDAKNIPRISNQSLVAT